MKRAMITALSPMIIVIFGELERSGNPRSEFHTVSKLYQNKGFDTQIIVTNLKK